LIAENVKRIEVVDIKPVGDLVEITGKNAQGKTSVLDAIWWALGGTKPIQDEPIRRGADEALIQLDLGDFIVRRTFAKGEAGLTTTLSVRTRDGAEYRRPQQTIDTFFNTLSLDPLAFLRMKDEDKFSLLRAFVPDVDFEKIEAENKVDYDKRRDLNVAAKQLRAVAARFIADGEEDLPAEPVDVAALQSELEAAGRHNGEIETRKARREAAETTIETKRRRASEMHEQAASLRRQADQIEKGGETLDEEAATLAKRLADADPLPEPIEPSEIVGRLNAAQAINRRIDTAQQRRAAVAEADSTEAAAKALTKAMEERTKATEAAVAAAALPVEGLTLTAGGGVLLDGFPFAQASDAAQLRASISLAMAMNPKLRVIRVRDGSLLDDDSMAIVATMAKEHGFQVWIERVGTNSETGFELVAGRLRKAPAPAPAEASA
jgi:DNA repair exonuclease SbcCD ATPase subunit